jgi:hypothetical protein
MVKAVSKRSRLVYWLGVFAFLQYADAILTALLLHVDPTNLYEGNPLHAFLWAHGGFLALLAAKTVGIIIMSMMRLYEPHVSTWFRTIMRVGFVTVSALVVIYGLTGVINYWSLIVP